MPYTYIGRPRLWWPSCRCCVQQFCANWLQRYASSRHFVREERMKFVVQFCACPSACAFRHRPPHHAFTPWPGRSFPESRSLQLLVMSSRLPGRICELRTADRESSLTRYRVSFEHVFVGTVATACAHVPRHCPQTRRHRRVEVAFNSSTSTSTSHPIVVFISLISSAVC